MYLLDLERSMKDGSQWVYMFEREVLSGDPSDG
jgi:hypothetical protein